MLIRDGDGGTKCDSVVPFLKGHTGVKIGKSAWPSVKV